MATRSVKKSANSSERVLAPDFNPRDSDLKYTGSEPVFVNQPDLNRRKMALILSFNWYGRFCVSKHAKEFLLQYATETGKTDHLKLLQRCDERMVRNSIAWLARMYSRGLNLTENETAIVNEEIDRLIDTVKNPAEKSSATGTKKQETKSAETVTKPNIQDIMRERTREVAGEIEGWLDDFVSTGAKNISVNPVASLTEKNILPQHIAILTEVWRRHLAEYQEVLSGKDSQLNEAYSHFSKTQLKNLVKFCEAVLSGLDGYISLKKSNKTARTRKPQSPEKVASKMKYQRSYEDTATKLKLTSVTPSKIIGATEVWAYDTAKRKLHYYVADSHVGTLGIKGTTIVGFDATNSGVKTIRKPEIVIKELVSAGKPASRKIFKEVKSVHAKPNGRTNENLVILKVG